MARKPPPNEFHPTMDSVSCPLFRMDRSKHFDHVMFVGVHSLCRVQVLGEYTALCRDAQLVEETRNPYLPTFDTNYRMFG